MIYLSGLCALVALIFSVLNLTVSQPKLNLTAWALLLLAIAVALPSVVIVVNRAG